MTGGGGVSSSTELIKGGPAGAQVSGETARFAADSIVQSTRRGENWRTERGGYVFGGAALAYHALIPAALTFFPQHRSIMGDDLGFVRETNECLIRIKGYMLLS